MKSKKNRFICIIVLIFCIFISVSVFAGIDKSDVVVSLQVNNPIMKVNGVETEIDGLRGTTPVIVNGRTLVPIRAIIEAFNGSVSWDENTQSVFLNLNDDVIKLVIKDYTAYFNETAYSLDVAPDVIDGRTVLPIRFIAEKFNFGVAWNNDTKTVSIIRNLFDEQEYQYLKSVLTEYCDAPYIIINNNKPMFKDYEIISDSFEYYSSLDNLGRCDVAMASVAKDLMPTEKRESISSVKPTGWINKSYDIISGGYLYNRCHLIGYQLTGENANERNLITGTKYLNIEGMLPFENTVDDYIEKTNNTVMYRVTPVFTENNLVADGVLMEAYSIEDNGAGISFCIYCYNVQPNIYIDYATGDSRIAENNNISTTKSQEINVKVYRTPTGKSYHFDIDCGGKNSFETVLEKALADGLTPCKKCTK